METTLFPLATLPPCAARCGPLYDVNGGCVPPAAPRADVLVYGQCFCNDARLSAWSTDTATPDLCNGACPQAADLASIQGWYASYCANVRGAQPGAQSGEQPAAQPESSPSQGETSGAVGGTSGGGGGGTWLSTHYNWVIFLVVMVVSITGIWMGACIWRRKYLQKRDRDYALGNNLAHQTESGRVVPNPSNSGSVHVPGAGFFEPAPISSAGVYEAEKTTKREEKKQKKKKKWVVKERT